MKQKHLLVAALLAATSGIASAVPFTDVYLDDDVRVVGGYGFGPDNSAYFVAIDDGATSMKRVGNDGEVVWETSFTGVASGASNVAVGAGDACSAVLVNEAGTGETQTLSLRCFHVADGVAEPAVQIATGVPIQEPSLYIGTNGARTVLYNGVGGGVRYATVSDAGAVTSDVAIANADTFEATAFAANGAALVSQSTTGSYTFLAPGGAVTGTVSGATLGLDSVLATIAPDGTLFVQGVQEIATLGRRTVAVKLGTNGVEAWRRVLRDEEFIAFPPAFGDGAVFFGISHDAVPGDDIAQVEAPHAYVALDYANGTVRWDVDVPPAEQAFFRSVVSSDGERLIAVSTALSNKVRVQTRSTEDGEILADFEADCTTTSCSAFALRSNANTALRIIARNNQANGHAVLTLTETTPPATRTAVSTRGLRGAWTIGTNGQGIALDYDAASQTLFGAWFTTAFVPIEQQQTTDITGLRWYTIQANWPDGSMEREVTIFETAGGTFAAGAPINGTAVGSGTLRVIDCGNASLTYQFDGDTNGGASGVIGLSRLTPRSDACTITEGGTPTTSPPEMDPIEANGFDADQSGSWAQAGSAGQGILFVVQPTVGISGAWFTFDPAGSSNDPKNHHWFTLQGSLATATNGTAELAIFQTVGGTFDFRPSTATTQVGTATVTFTSCTAASLTYTFTAGAGAFANRTGTIALEHLGGCPAP